MPMHWVKMIHIYIVQNKGCCTEGSVCTFQYIPKVYELHVTVIYLKSMPLKIIELDQAL